jgi:hypothetical protein
MAYGKTATVNLFFYSFVRRKINRAWHQYRSKRARIAGLLGQSVPGIGLWEDAAASGQFLLHHRSSVVRRA